jgi:hypothetical protein
MTEIEIFWSAFEEFGRETKSLKFEWDINPLVTEEFLEILFRDTNLYEGKVWEAISSELPEGRSHTALSVHDKVRIGNELYVCEAIGWEKI